MNSEARLTTIKQRDRARRRVRAATAIAALGAAVGGGVLTAQLAAPTPQTTATVSSGTASSGTSSTAASNSTVAPTASRAQDSASTSGGS
jgi:hypothetical protein